MKIAVISSTVFACPPSGYSGLEFLAWQIAKGLAAKGHQVALIAPQGSTCPGATIIPTGPPGGWDEHKAYDSYWQQLLAFDVCIDHTWSKYSLTLKEEGRLKAPVLCVCHAPVNTMFESMPPVEKPCFVGISKDMCGHFEGLFGRPMRLAYNGIDLDFYKAIPMPRSGRFLFLARFSTIKGPDLAIQACKDVGVGLDLIGDTSITNEPDFFERCRRMCDWGAAPDSSPETGRINYGSLIRMVGPATRGNCVWWFGQAHCLLHPNQRFREPLGLAPLESQACGSPVIAWDFGAMRETIKNKETGWLVRSVAELNEMVKAVNAGIDDAMRKRCREWAGQFSEQAMVNDYERLCIEAIESGGW